MRIELDKLEGTGGQFAHRYEPEELVLDDEHAIEHPDDIARILVNAGNPPTRLAVPYFRPLFPITTTTVASSYRD